MISVIVPVYNRAQYIVDCIESVLRQTYTDYELLIIDDGSTDNLRDVLAPYRGRIRYIHKENGGAASARNEGLRQARGEYIAFLDSDDIWLPFKLKLEMAVLERLPATVGFVHSDFSCISEQKTLIADSYTRDYFFTLDTYQLTYSALYAQRTTLHEMGVYALAVPDHTEVYWGDVSDKVILGPMFLPSTILARRSCLAAAGYFNETYPSIEDYEYLTRVAKCCQVAFLNTPTICYRRFHDDQLSGEKMEVVSNQMLLRVAVEQGLHDPELMRDHGPAVRRRISHCYYGLGIAHFRKKQYQEALRAFGTSLRMNYRQRKIYFYAAAVMFLMGHSRFDAIIRPCEDA